MKLSITKIAVITLALIITGFIIYKYFLKDPLTGNTTAAYKNNLESVMAYEQKHPAKFLKIIGKSHNNLLGTKVKYKGEITNSATKANYKNVVLNITFFSKTKNVLTAEQHTINEFFPVQSTTGFDLKVDRPDKCDSIGLQIINATSY